MTILVCDKCGKEIKENVRYVVAYGDKRPNEKGELPPKNWIMVKEVCQKCALEIEQLFNKR